MIQRDDAVQAGVLEDSGFGIEDSGLRIRDSRIGDSRIGDEG
jgi:hypothetical protein